MTRALALLLALAACGGPPFPPPPPEETRPTTALPGAPVTSASATPEAGPPDLSVDGRDPVDGKFTLDDATKNLEGTGPLVATITTSMGVVRCDLYDDKAPVSVANFVGLARGLRPFKAANGKWVKQPAYDGTTFHRVIKGFMIQGGDPRGTGMGDPGYVVIDEIWPGALHDKPGQLCMANRGPNTNGMQFFITDAAVARLDGKYTIFGLCKPETVIHAIAAVPTGPANRPDVPVKIEKIEITR